MTRSYDPREPLPLFDPGDIDGERQGAELPDAGDAVSTSVIAAAVDVVGDETPQLLRPLLWAAALAVGPKILQALRTYTPRPGELCQLAGIDPAALAVLRASQAARDALERDLAAAAADATTTTTTTTGDGE